MEQRMAVLERLSNLYEVLYSNEGRNDWLAHESAQKLTDCNLKPPDFSYVIYSFNHTP